MTYAPEKEFSELSGVSMWAARPQFNMPLSYSLSRTLSSINIAIGSLIIQRIMESVKPL